MQGAAKHTSCKTWQSKTAGHQAKLQNDLQPQCRQTCQNHAKTSSYMQAGSSTPVRPQHRTSYLPCVPHGTSIKCALPALHQEWSQIGSWRYMYWIPKGHLLPQSCLLSIEANVQANTCTQTHQTHTHNCCRSVVSRPAASCAETTAATSQSNSHMPPAAAKPVSANENTGKAKTMGQPLGKQKGCLQVINVPCRHMQNRLEQQGGSTPLPNGECQGVACTKTPLHLILQPQFVVMQYEAQKPMYDAVLLAAYPSKTPSRIPPALQAAQHKAAQGPQPLATMQYRSIQLTDTQCRQGVQKSSFSPCSASAGPWCMRRGCGSG